MDSPTRKHVDGRTHKILTLARKSQQESPNDDDELSGKTALYVQSCAGKSKRPHRQQMLSLHCGGARNQDLHCVVDFWPLPSTPLSPRQHRRGFRLSCQRRAHPLLYQHCSPPQ